MPFVIGREFMPLDDFPVIPCQYQLLLTSRYSQLEALFGCCIHLQAYQTNDCSKYCACQLLCLEGFGQKKEMHECTSEQGGFCRIEGLAFSWFEGFFGEGLWVFFLLLWGFCLNFFNSSLLRVIFVASVCFLPFPYCCVEC